MPTREEMDNLAQHIIVSYDARVEGVAQIRAATQGQLKDYDQAHIAMAQRQRAELARGRVELRTSVSNQLQDLDRSHNAMARQLRADLSQGEASRKQDEAQRAQERDHLVAQRKSDVGAQLQDLHNTQSGAREAWQNMAATLRRRRAGAETVAPPPAVLEEAPLPETPPEPEVEEEDAVERAEVGEATDEFNT